MTSPVFKALLVEQNATAESPTQLDLSADDGDAMFYLLHILHLRNQALPPRVPPETLHKLAGLAAKYQCAVAVGRATLQWFDILYHNPREQSGFDIFKVIEAAQLLDEPTYFARFTERCVLSVHLAAPITAQNGSSNINKLAGEWRPTMPGVSFSISDENLHLSLIHI